MTYAEEDSKRWFCQLGTQYYVAGRYAARAALIPVCGNLLHHAVEMYLKAALIGIESVDDLKNKYGHDLLTLWRRFKASRLHPSLARFDATVTNLQAFESVRYPNSMVTFGFHGAVAWTPAEAAMSGLSHRLHKYEVVVTAVDELVVAVLQNAGVDPKSMARRLGWRRPRVMLLYQNPQAELWRIE